MKRRGLIMWAAALSAVFVLPCAHAAPAGELRFTFTDSAPPGATLVQWNQHTGAPVYDKALGYGFVEQTSALPARPVHLPQIRNSAKGFTITEPLLEKEKGFEALHYNHFGMAFRIKAAPGAYAIRVRTTSDAADTIVSVSGMQTSRLTGPVYWDAASLIPNRTLVTAQGRDWTYRYVNGRDTIDIEVEPAKAGVPVGIAEIVVTPIAPAVRPAGALPAIFTLGDSTVKSYTFDEAPMSGWGQVFDHLFDPRSVKVINYSIGGRSFRNAYAEGRLNDLLLTGHSGDIVMIQFGHNDESADEARRFGRGASEAMYEAMIREVYIPAIRSRGMVPVLVTPMSRVNGTQKADQPYVSSFKTRRFPELMKKLGAELGVPVVDLNARSVEYYNQIGAAATTAMVMSIEAGETPGKTNDGSYANGHPSNKIDGTHFKESMSKQYARLVVAELGRLADQGDAVATRITAALKPEVRAAMAASDWRAVQPEIADDIAGGDGAYYRNQIEKLIQLGVMAKDRQGRFHPDQPMMSSQFATALAHVLGLPPSALHGGESALTREVMGAMLADAYALRFKAKPAYMTDYNGNTVVPGSPGYDPNLDSGAQGAMYYPLVNWESLSDTKTLDPRYTSKVKQAYELGLMRSEAGIARGRMVNGRTLDPKSVVTRAKAAKALYFMWVLGQPPKAENDVLKETKRE